MTGAFRSIVVAGAPMLETFADGITKAMQATGAWMENNRGVLKRWAEDVVEGFGIVADSAQWLTTQLGNLASKTDDGLAAERAQKLYQQLSGEKKAFQGIDIPVGFGSGMMVNEQIKPRDKSLYESLLAQQKQAIIREREQKQLREALTRQAQAASPNFKGRLEQLGEAAIPQSYEGVERLQTMVEQSEKRAKDFVQSIRSQQYLTSDERMEALQAYTDETATTLEAVAESHRVLNTEIVNIEKSRVNQFRVYQTRLRSDMQNTGLFVAEKAASMAQSIEGSMSNAFVKMIQQGASLRDAIVGFANEIQAAFVRIAADMAARSIMGMAMGGLGGLFGGGSSGPPDIFAGPHHMGGVVGPGSGGPKRRVPAALFMGAPRLHNGLGPNEFPAILEGGETVIPKGFGIGRPEAPKVVINNNSGVPMTQGGGMEFDGKQWVIDIVSDNYHRGGEMRDLMKGRPS